MAYVLKKKIPNDIYILIKNRIIELKYNETNINLWNEIHNELTKTLNLKTEYINIRTKKIFNILDQNYDLLTYYRIENNYFKFINEQRKKVIENYYKNIIPK